MLLTKMANLIFKNDAIAIFLAIGIGSLWGQSLSIWPLASIIVIPVLWSRISHRYIAGLIPAFYALFATRGLIEGSAIYFERDIGFGLCLWLIAAIPHYFAGLFAWFTKPKKRVYLGIPLLCLFLVLPPVMLVGWAHPLLAAGLWFPKAGLGSIGLCLGLMVFLAMNVSAKWRISVMVLIAIQAIYRSEAPSINTTPNWVAHHTQFPDIDTVTPLSLLQRHWTMQNQVEQPAIHVFPESVGGDWNHFLADSWQYAIPEQATVLLGAYLYQQGYWQNIVVSINKHSHEVIYTQRLPMTAGMYNPFSTTRFQANWWGKSVANVNGKRVGFAICFEHVVLWPMLQTAWQHPDIVIAPASIWWSPKSLQLAQRQSLRLWQLWLNAPIIESINGVKS